MKPRHSNALSLCDVPPWIVASREFNDDPRPLTLHGAYRVDRFLFDRLDSESDPAARATLFDEYMSVKFYLHQWGEESQPAKRSIKNSYQRFLRGWGVDSNSVEGAVLKGWVESRFGLVPNFHKRPICSDIEEDYTPYDLDRMRGHTRTNSIHEQFDLLYRYTQYELARCELNRRWLRLYRGTYDAHEHTVTERVSQYVYYVRLNNLSSFTTDMERAWEFGTTVWAVDVPTCKIFFYGNLLPSSILKGENEHLVIGGEFRVSEVRS
ncbi:MAG TPA: NAD(+)--dinitrogen-reductase ADP-D-ribosyltransferase [Polyangiaceae bacterium]|nr:NAD(+)--dinitrogen-reductase ADP-D-ribosyltransferase [Polyangiaceae bacterium]